MRTICGHYNSGDANYRQSDTFGMNLHTHRAGREKEEDQKEKSKEELGRGGIRNSGQAIGQLLTQCTSTYHE